MDANLHFTINSNFTFECLYQFKSTQIQIHYYVKENSTFSYFIAYLSPCLDVNVDWRLFVPGSAAKPEKDTLQTIDTDCYTVSTVHKCIQNYIGFLSGKDMCLHPELSK